MNPLQYKIFDDFTVRHYVPNENNAILIRLLNPYYQQAGIPYPQTYTQRYAATLDLYVDDIIEETPRGKEVFTLFNKQMAQQIKGFVDQHPFSEIVVHCSYGESRSPAVMMGIAHHLGDDVAFHAIKNNTQYHPNELILRYMLTV